MVEVPFISEIWDGIRSAIDWSLRVMPRPLLYAIFMMTFLIIANVMLPFFFNMTGTLCIEGDKYSNNNFAFLTNAWAMLKVKTIDEQTFNLSGSKEVTGGCTRNYINATNESETFYDGKLCTTCDVIDSKEHPSYLEYGFPLFDHNKNKCAGDAYRTPELNKSWWQKLWCDGDGEYTWRGGACEPPSNYYYDKELDIYNCVSGYDCGNKSQKSDLIQQFKEKGFNFIPEPPEDKAKMFGLKCFGNVPKMALFGINIFNYTLWILITLVCMLIWAYVRFGRTED